MCPVNTYINSQEPGEVLTVNALYEWTLHYCMSGHYILEDGI